MRRRLHVMVVCGSALAVAACASSRHGELRSELPLSMAEPSTQADHLWETIQDTLRRHGFQLDRVDRAAGVITTLPETSPHFFEFWRNDVATSRDAWEATLNPIRRRVEVTLRSAGEGAWSGVCIAVYKERLSSPDRQFNSTGAAYQYFGDSLPSTSGQSRVTAVDDRWLELGRDQAMEDRLLREIAASCPAVARDPTSDSRADVAGP